MCSHSKPTKVCHAQMTGFDQRVGSDRIQASNSPCHTMNLLQQLELCHGGRKKKQFHNTVWCNSKGMEEMDRPESLCSSHQVKNKTLNSLINFIRQTAYSLQLWKTIQFWKCFEDSVTGTWIETEVNTEIFFFFFLIRTKIPLSILSSVYMFPCVKIANRRPVHLPEVYGL